MKQNWRIVLSLLAVFLSGVFVGGFSHRAYSVKAVVKDEQKPCSPEDYRRKYIEELRTRLHLDQAQLEKLTVILDETRQRYSDVQATVRPEMKQIQAEQVERVRSILTDAQKPEYAKLLEERERRIKEKKSQAAKP